MSGTQLDTAVSRRDVELRQASAADLAALRDFFGGLSVQSRYLRFFTAIIPTPAMLRVLSGCRGDEAVVATHGGAIAGHALAADRVGPDGLTTDFGVVVTDAWQGRGVGSALVRALIAGAAARGVTTMAMDVLPANHRVLAMIAGHWPSARLVRAGDSVTIRAPLPRFPPLTMPLSELSGQLRIRGAERPVDR